MTGSLPVSVAEFISDQLNFIEFGVISETGTALGAFINVGTESAKTTLSAE